MLTNFTMKSFYIYVILIDLVDVFKPIQIQRLLKYVICKCKVIK